MSRVPRIRFKGFEEDWEQRKLGEVCNIITKQTGFDYSSTIKPALFKEKADNTYPFIQNKDFNGTTINMDTDFFIPISVAEKFPNIVLDRPSILISISGRIGNVGFYSCVHKAFIGGAVGICKLKYNDDGKFIIHELESEYGQKYFYSLIKASSHANITVEDIRNMELIFPKKKEEKICISTFFSSFDHLITLHQRKLEKLKIIKKSMLENLFPQNGEKTPKNRFSGFTKDWEQRKLSEIALRESNFRLSSPDLPCVEYEDVVSEAGILNNDIRSKKIVKTGIVFDDNHVLYGKLRPYLHNWLCPYFSGVAVGDWWVLKPCYVVREFIYRIIQTKRFDNATNQSYGSKMPRADWNLVSNTEFMIPPDSSEQEKIGLYFKEIDNLITLHQSKLEKLQKIKKSMLESMFV